jgi:hypothetical protein
MNRRDFLLFTPSQGKRIVELSCERLYMRAVDAQAGSAGEAIEPQDTWLGEPPRVIALPTIDDLFKDLASELRGVDVLRLVDSHWLASDELKHRLEEAIVDFRARGGIVEI